MSLKENIANITRQWGAMIARGTIPILEYPLTNEDGSEDYLTVDLSLSDGKIYFVFDDRDLPCWFSGEVKGAHGEYSIKIDEYVDYLDSYLEQIDQEIMEGWILPNNLDRID